MAHGLPGDTVEGGPKRVIIILLKPIASFLPKFFAIIYFAVDCICQKWPFSRQAKQIIIVTVMVKQKKQYIYIYIWQFVSSE